MIPVRLLGNSARPSAKHLADGLLSVPSGPVGFNPIPAINIRCESTDRIKNEDWASQTVDTMACAGVAFSETRKHKMDGDTCCHSNVDPEAYERQGKLDSLANSEDDRFNAYDPSCIGLSGVMQTNVPEPYEASSSDGDPEAFMTDHAVALNMPGGTLSQKTKYLSGQLNLLDIDQSRH